MTNAYVDFQLLTMKETNKTIANCETEEEKPEMISKSVRLNLSKEYESFDIAANISNSSH